MADPPAAWRPLCCASGTSSRPGSHDGGRSGIGSSGHWCRPRPACSSALRGYHPGHRPLPSLSRRLSSGQLLLPQLRQIRHARQRRRRRRDAFSASGHRSVSPRPVADAGYVIVPDPLVDPTTLRVVRVRMSRMALATLGMPLVNPDADSLVEVEILVGDEGVAQSIRRAVLVSEPAKD